MNLILFFNGWGMDGKVVKTMKVPKNFTVEVLNFPYKYDAENLKKYEKIYFIGWSFGCYYLSKFLIENNIKSENATALNGTPEIIGEKGIPEKMFDFTLNTLTEETLLKFYKNMGISENFPVPKKDFSFIKNELVFLKENYKPLKNIFTKAVIGKKDKIVPSARQKKYFNEKNVEITEMNFPHYPFDVLKSWEELF